jgi:hypothetical protein
MTTPKTKEEILALLTALGDNAHDVAGCLMQLGIRGTPATCRSCPIAEYLISKGVEMRYPSDGVNISDDCVAVAADRNYYIYKQNQLYGVKEFIRGFDRGNYPQCEIA